ncbi:MAG: acetate kinase [Bacteroidetes bacterium GWF2_38_335]|nr:MAG: acetate kinase [Bacteroidetes bacterium GWF2_38_335]OFY79014.1 MAG: acetate kinase [Bacteroidetes bacterium RIFOXYA12_FULL_38_20]HBS86091.1 acetate kinase [Bacteroidales bacterium]
MKILVLNCGSSSIKYQLLDMKDESVLAQGIVERVGCKSAELTHKVPGRDKYILEQEIMDHTAGIDLILNKLMDATVGVLKDKNEITAVGHRVVHGGETFSGSVKITQQVIDKMEECVDLAPLHNPANLKGIYAMQKLLPDVPQCGTFDTAFHQTMPEHAFMYAIPYELYDKYKIRRYGFHGASHKFISETAAEFIGKKYNEVKIITCHLGNGASIAAVKNGKSVDTSMGLTPVEGLIMGTRAGDFDLGALFYIMDKEKMDAKDANNMVNKKSGVLGISGVGSDMRDIENAAWKENNHRAKLALEMYSYRVKKYIGSYAAAMGGCDIIVFSGGVGENGPETREAICSGLEFMGVEFNPEANKGLRGKLTDISKPSSKVKVLVVPTNEELVIARDAMTIING